MKFVGFIDEKDKMFLFFFIICIFWKCFEKIELEDCIFFVIGGVLIGSELFFNLINWFFDNFWIEMLNIFNLKNFYVRVFWNFLSIFLGDIFYV